MPDGPRFRRRERRSRFAAAIALLGFAAWRLVRGQSVSVVPRRAVVQTRPPQHDNPLTDYERSDWNLGPVAMVYAGILVLIVICVFVLIAAYPTSLPDVARSKRIDPPGPQLQTNPQADLQRFRAEEDQILHGYHWVDREKGLVRIPIEQAMKAIVASGIPGFPKEQP
jgi:hypothetical protein